MANDSEQSRQSPHPIMSMTANSQARELTVLGQRLLELLLLLLRQRAERGCVSHLGLHLLHCSAATQYSTSANRWESDPVQVKAYHRRYAESLLSVVAML